MPASSEWSEDFAHLVGVNAHVLNLDCMTVVAACVGARDATRILSRTDGGRLAAKHDALAECALVTHLIQASGIGGQGSGARGGEV